MTTVHEAGEQTPSGHAAAPVGARQRVAVAMAVAMAAAMLVTGIVGMGALQTYQVALDFVAAAALLATGWLLLSGRLRWLLIAVAWLSTIGVIAQFGDLQSRRNDTGALAATNTSYFLPALLWLYMFLLIVVAVLITMFSATPDDQRK